MKTSTLQSFAFSNSQAGNDTWASLDSIAKASGEDITTGKAAVLDFVVALALRDALEHYNDKRENLAKCISSKLSYLNEEYPFDVREANLRVNHLFSCYITLISGFSSYAEINKLIGVLRDVVDKNEGENNLTETPEQQRAWDNMY